MLSPGVQLNGRYRLDERIAGGGMGDVWRGTDEVLGRTVAVKVLLPALLEEPGFAERFRGEARTMANINHPGVVDVYDYGSDEDIAYLVMEYVEGDALSTTLGRVGRLTPARTMALAAQAADALQAAHEKGIVHRDVKPGNLLVRPNGTLVLTDFGIARSALVGQLTVAGSVLGTAAYISPEQAAGGVATPASDVYALGVVAYQCLSGRRPFEGDTPFEIAMMHVREVPPPLPSDIPPAVRSIVEKAMAKDPPARWGSAAQLATVARQAAGSLGTPGSTVTVPPAPSVSPAPSVPRSPSVPPASSVPRSPARATAPAVPARAPAARAASPAPVARQASAPPPPRPPVARPVANGYGRGAAPIVSPVQPRRPAQGYPYAPPRKSTNGWIVFLAVIAALIIVVCSAMIAYDAAGRRNRSSDSDSGSGAGSGQVAVSPSEGRRGQAAAQKSDIPCEKYIGQKYEKVKDDLEDSDFRVVRWNVARPEEGRVVNVTPCRAAKGQVVTVQVATGRIRGTASCGAIGAPVDCQRGDDD